MDLLLEGLIHVAGAIKAIHGSLGSGGWIVRRGVLVPGRHTLVFWIVSLSGIDQMWQSLLRGVILGLDTIFVVCVSQCAWELIFDFDQ